MRRFLLVVVLALCVSLMAGCCLSHKWVEATCETPTTCEKCGETEGEALGHVWSEATRQAPETCQVCGQTQGEVLSVYDVFPEGTPRYDDTRIFLTDQDFIELYGDALEKEGFSLITEDIGSGVPPMLVVTNPEGEMTGIEVIMEEDPETGTLASIQVNFDLANSDDDEKFDQYSNMAILPLDVLLGADQDSYTDEFTENMEVVGINQETDSVTLASEVSDMGMFMIAQGTSLKILFVPVNG